MGPNNTHSINKILRDLRHVASKVRTEQQALGYTQHALTLRTPDSPHPLEIPGVIYAIVSLHPRKVYIGQTKRSAMHRFKQHVTSARHPETKEGQQPLYKAMRRYGLDNFFLFPLEHIQYTHDDNNAKNDTKAFTTVATPREIFWINRLRTWRPRGYNTIYATRSRARCRHAHHNPMTRHSRQRHEAPSQDQVVARRIYAFRDWDRRISYLIRAHMNAEWQRIKLETYSARTLRSIIHHLQSRIDMKLTTINEHSFALTDLQHTLTKLRSYKLQYYKPPSRTPRITNPIPFRIQWHKHMLASVPLLRILKTAEGWPLPDECKDRLLIAKKLTHTTGSIICNYKHAAKTYTEYRAPDASCPCRQHYGSSFRPNDGCVVTMNLDIIEQPDLRALMKEGTHFRENERIDYADIIDEALGRFSRYCQQAHNASEANLAIWTHNVRVALNAQLPSPLHTTSILHTPQVRRALNRLKRHLVIVPTDKASKNFSLVCRHYYKHVLHNELHSEQGAYTTITHTPKEIYNQYAREIATHKTPLHVRKHLIDAIRQEQYKLPILYWIPKMHKNPPKARFIAASYDVMTTPLARTINQMLKLVKHELKIRDMNHIHETGVKRCWFVDGFEEVTRWLRALERPGNQQERTLQTYDFATMYTTLDQTNIVDSLRFAINEAFGTSHQALYYHGPSAPCTWHDSSSPGRPNPNPYLLYTAADITKLIDILVHNIYIQNGTHIRQQTVGLPMGTNPAPHLADLTCYAHEARTMDRLMHEDINKARGFLGTFRYIDDILAADNPHLEHLIHIEGEHRDITHPIYPPFLSLNRTTDSPHHVDYLGMTISHRLRSFHINVTNTKQRFPYPKVNYPSLHGNFPHVLAYGVFTGQLHRFARICTSSNDFIACATQLCSTLIPKGYTYAQLRQHLKTFLNTHNPYKTRWYTMYRAFMRMMI